MLSELFAVALSVFVLDPLQAEFNDRLPAFQNQAQASSVMRNCANLIGPHLLEKASSDYWWTTSTIIGVATGMIEPSSVLTQGPSACQTALSMLGAKNNNADES